MPFKELKAFKRVHILKAGSSVVEFRIPVAELQKWDLQKHQWKLYSGSYTIVAGGNSQDGQLTATVTLK